jgi:class 3 adenylate cyclase
VWLRRVQLRHQDREDSHPPDTVVTRAANAPIALAAFTLLTWVLADILLLFRVHTVFEEITLGTWAHLIIRPLLAGLIASTAVFLATEYICRAHAWPIMLAHTQIEGNPRFFKIRVAHRFFFLWLAISFLPLSALALTAFIRMDTLHLTADPVHSLFMYVIIFIGASAALGGAALAWLVARSMGQPLRALERAMARLRGGDFSVREQVTGTDEIGALAEGFNLMTQRLAESYQALEARNRELTEALERVTFLESVKRGLDRFVPDTVRRAIETNPDGPALLKAPKDVTVLFLDIQGYTRLSEELPPDKLNEVVERYFSLFLSDIREGGGDINETAGDGLMILFQDGTAADHAVSAVRTALGIREKTAAANREDGPAHRPIAVNIGISSGECEVGSTRFQSLGGERWTFTATGPVTNLAARLRDHATNGQILLGAETARRVSDRFQIRRLGPIPLKNIATPVEVCEVSA